MHISAVAVALETLASTLEADLPVAEQIEQFLRGESDGGALLEMLYGRVEDEPVPERLLAIVRNAC